jgi:Phage major capsid protein E
MATLEELLSPVTITEVISRIKTPKTRLQNFYGLGPGGTNSTPIGGDKFAFDIFDSTRKTAKGRAKGAGPATARRDPIGSVTGYFYRSHEQVPLMLHKIWGNRPLGGMVGEVDPAGSRYISAQERNLVQRFKNTREQMIALMFTAGSFDILVNGDDWTIVATGSGSMTIDFQHPAGNRGSVGGIFAQNWGTNPTTALPLNELMALNKASAAASGFPISQAWCNSTTMTKVLNTDQVAALAGTSNSPFSEFSREAENGFVVQLKGIPWLTWHVYDDVLDLNGTETILIPDNDIILTPDPSSDWLEGLEGSEPARRTSESEVFVATGMSGWTSPEKDPPAEVLKMVDNFMVAPYVPKAWYYVDNATA